jgi:hypothetical protein
MRRDWELSEKSWELSEKSKKDEVYDVRSVDTRTCNEAERKQTTSKRDSRSSSSMNCPLLKHEALPAVTRGAFECRCAKLQKPIVRSLG